MLHREHWWYLPRLVIVLENVRAEELRPREGPSDVVLGVDDGGPPSTARRRARRSPAR
jgi:hypothetical protein